MKKFIKTGLVAVVGLAFIVASCNKYPDGPKISLLTKKARIANTWTVEQYMFNNSDQTSSMLSLLGNNSLTIEKGGTYSSSSNFGSDAGTWKFGEDKDDVYMTSNTQGSQEMAYHILKLESKELWVTYTHANGDVDEWHYKQK